MANENRLDRIRVYYSEGDESMKPSTKKKGQKPIYDHQKIKELLLAHKKPIEIMLLLGCSYGVVRYVRNRIRKGKL